MFSSEKKEGKRNVVPVSVPVRPWISRWDGKGRFTSASSEIPIFYLSVGTGCIIWSFDPLHLVILHWSRPFSTDKESPFACWTYVKLSGVAPYNSYQKERSKNFKGTDNKTTAAEGWVGDNN